MAMCENWTGKKFVSMLDCSICLSCFKEPKLLPCFHTFCLQCLDEYVIRTGRNGKFECPLCRESIEIPVGGVKVFQSNFYVQADALSEDDVDCDICENGQKSTHYCLECEEHFCERCTTAHTKMKVSREHKILELNDTSKGERQVRKVLRKKYCSHHSGQEINMICKDCDILLCVVCKLTEHENHKTSGIAKEAAERKAALTLRIEEIEKSLELYRSNILKAKSIADEVNDKLETSIKKLDSRVDEVVSLIKEEGNRLKKELMGTSTKTLDYLSKKKKYLKDKIKERESIVNHARNVIEIGDDLQYLDFKLMEQLKLLEIMDGNVLVETPRFVTFKAGVSKDVDNFIGQTVVCEFEVTQLEQLHLSINTHNSNAIAAASDMTCVSFLDYSKLILVDTEEQKYAQIASFSRRGFCAGITFYNSDTCYFTCTNDKALYKLCIKDKSCTMYQLFGNYPHGIAKRRCRNELLVCISDSSKVLELESFRGCVIALSLDKNMPVYQWRTPEMPGPTCIAVCETDETICLGYPAGQKVTLNASNGDVLSEFTGAGCHGNPARFCPVSVCFDNHMGIIIADHGNGAVVRINEGGKYLQCLLKEDFPLCVALSQDHTLFVGFKGKDIARYKLK